MNVRENSNHLVSSVQALTKNAKKHGLHSANDANWGFLKLMISLALLPETLIMNALNIITNVIFNTSKNEKLQNFVHYYTKTWVNGYTPKLFCVFKRIHRTNNISERHNRQLKKCLKEHSTIIEFLGTLST